MTTTEQQGNKDVLEKATPRPWEPYHVGRSEHYIYAPDARYDSLPGNPSPVKVAYLPPSPGSERPYHDASLIAAAVNDYERLLQIERLARASVDRTANAKCSGEGHPVCFGVTGGGANGWPSEDQHAWAVVYPRGTPSCVYNVAAMYGPGEQRRRTLRTALDGEAR